LRMAVAAQKSLDFSFWSDDQCQMMHSASIEILERVGVQVQDKEALKLLKKAGCLIKDDLVRIPGALVQWALASAPRRITLANAAGKRVCVLEDKRINFAMCNDCVWFYDSRTRQIRRARLSDAEDAAKVADTLDQIDLVSSLSLAGEVTIGLSDLYQFRAMRQHTTKPILSSALSRSSLEALIEMAIVSAGSPEEFRMNPNIVVYCEPISPLIHIEDGLQKLQLCADHGVPVVYAPAPLSGATAPVSPSGCFALSLAEALSGLVVHQLRKPGAPFILAGLAGPLDMKTMVAVYADPLVSLYNAATGAMGRFYGIPTYGTSGTTDSCLNDIQAAMENTFSIVMSALSGMSLIHDNGYTGSGMIGNLESLLMNNEIITMAKQYMRGIEVSEETVPLALIDEIGPGGHYLLAEHTMKHFKSETYYPRYMNRKGFLLWQSEDGTDMGDKLNAGVLKLLEQKGAGGIADRQLAELDRIILQQEKRLAQAPK